ncbi:MAG: hypothetical protein ACTSU2_08235 [Promethearchaeota archaeon]
MEDKNFKILYSILTIMGFVLSNPVFIPFGIICASILLFQKKYRVFLVFGVLIIVLDIIITIVFIQLDYYAANLVPYNWINAN